MTRQEYDILREHGERLLAIENALRELPQLISERMEIKVTDAIASCRESHKESDEHISRLWEQHHQEKGASKLIDRVSTRTSFIIGSIGTVIAIAATVLTLVR